MNYKKIIIVTLFILGCLSSARFFNDINYWLLDIFSHFPVQYTFVSLVLLSICLWKKYVSLAALAGIVFLINSVVLVDFGKSVQAAKQEEAKFTVYSLNVHKQNDDFSRLVRELEEIDPEIVLLLEVTPEHVEQISPVTRMYPFHIEMKLTGDFGVGFVFLSKYPVLNHRITKLSVRGNIIVEAMLEVNKKQVMYYGVHAQRPALRNYDERKTQMLQLANHIHSKSLPSIVAGDLNSTPYSLLFRQFLEVSGLRDSRTGFGWQPSWPTYVPLFWLPIDHVLVSPDIVVHKRTTGSYVGSDHYPVMATLSIYK